MTALLAVLLFSSLAQASPIGPFTLDSARDSSLLFSAYHTSGMTFVSPSDIDNRLQWLLNQPRRQTGNRGSIEMQDLDYSGFPPGAEIIVADSKPFYHFTTRDNARLYLQEQFLRSGGAPYTRALHAGSEMIYMNYPDAGGVFFINRRVQQHELGYIGAASFEALVQVTLPPGTKLIKAPSYLDDLPFFIIPMAKGQAIRAKVEVIPF